MDGLIDYLQRLRVSKQQRAPLYTEIRTVSEHYRIRHNKSMGSAAKAQEVGRFAAQEFRRMFNCEPRTVERHIAGKKTFVKVYGPDEWHVVDRAFVRAGLVTAPVAAGVAAVAAAE